ncbi:DUF2065 domain-containing protein [Inhella gelatinilytica]|uniref:DUF2065 domain-containing protein n=1 Tax=Inhella gelatinilytica TaxID=2795030 RepID=A0A931NFE9_9BURK|nr:DUF2065 domain-containing protein [Inhella gelatinilytica]MBH9553476.1 DUF2065 domain-containing protein [Inhella gelatinilytica]
MWETLGWALGMVLIFEGLMPLISPGQWRAVFSRLLQFNDGQLRFVGLLSVGSGLLTLLWLA